MIKTNSNKTLINIDVLLNKKIAIKQNMINYHSECVKNNVEFKLLRQKLRENNIIDYYRKESNNKKNEKGVFYVNIYDVNDNDFPQEFKSIVDKMRLLKNLNLSLHSEFVNCCIELKKITKKIHTIELLNKKKRL